MNPLSTSRRPARRRSVRALSVLRSRVAVAFRTLARGVDPAMAQQRTTGFYRASGMAWASVLR